MRLRTTHQSAALIAALLACFVAPCGCASDQPTGLHRIASQVPAGSVIVPAGTQDVYVQHHGGILLSTAHYHAKVPSTQPEALPFLFLFIHPDERVDVFVPKQGARAAATRPAA